MKRSNKTVIVAGLVMATLAAGILAYFSYGRGATPRATAAEAVQPLPVVLTPVRQMVFEERIVVSGNVTAKHSALVSARISGVLDAVYVDRGDAVESGQPLFQTDAERLRRAVETAEQQVNVAAATVTARSATVARITADLAKVQLDYARYRRLYEQDRAVTKSAFEAQQSHFDQVRAALAEAEAGLVLARARARQADSHLAIARKDLADALVTAPIAGRVSERRLEPGEMAAAGAVVLRIEDVSVVELCAFLPENHFARVAEGRTILRARSGGIDIGEAVITTKSPTIHSTLRTFEIKALLKDPPYGVVPGARVDMTIVLQTQSAPGVPREAVLRRGPGQAVFTVRDGQAHLLAVETGPAADGWIAVRGEGLAPDTPIVHMGQERLNPGTAVVVVAEEEAAQ
ncbi:efflux RND transporter periplasmic adaptor subunit [Desulfatitalea alkaliphila]|uniref:Efflux RND transporter periplasmic adaptor subunit n=1 Tax=Desulfatitalea alkaliphila TaxID=2929485 RepID=A0AA41R091_9BACT|nr:efflux RND transporter periplasmic adaptor subunit [Desulfatitalea alkaliphila]MCJ8499774.1 efflux RND transporter periplasmic adaptor subunit [Desulfatitalea alkaliphila]